jgi:hypothetical protein
MNAEIDNEISTRDANALGNSATGDLIANWASRVIVLWEQSRMPEPTPLANNLAELADSYRVRDELNSRLQCGVPAVSGCSQSAVEILEAADSLFTRFTVEASSVTALSAYNHYPRQAEWWWKRLPRDTAPTTSFRAS